MFFKRVTKTMVPWILPRGIAKEKLKIISKFTENTHRFDCPGSTIKWLIAHNTSRKQYTLYMVLDTQKSVVSFVFVVHCRPWPFRQLWYPTYVTILLSSYYCIVYNAQVYQLTYWYSIFIYTFFILSLLYEILNYN